MASNRNSIVAGIVILAAAVGFLAWKGILGYPPKGTEGTIGAAQRYQSPQITAEDVKLDDPQTQAFIQSDLFHRMQTDAAFRKTVIEQGLSSYMEAEARAIALRSAAEQLVKSAENAQASNLLEKSRGIALAAAELEKKRVAAFSAELERKKGAALSVEAERALIALSNQVLELGGSAELAKNEELAGNVRELERACEALAINSEAARGAFMVERAAQYANRAEELATAAEAAKATNVALEAREIAKAAQVLAATKEAERTNAEAEARILSLVQKGEALAISAEFEKSEQAAAKASAMRIAVNGLARMSEPARATLVAERAAQVSAQAREVEKRAQAAKMTVMAKEVAELAAKAEELARNKQAAMGADVEQAMAELARRALALQSSADLARLGQTEASARTLARSINAFSRTNQLGRVNVSRIFTALASQIEAGKFTNE